MTLVTSDLKDENGCMYLSNANATIVLIETDTEIVLITGVARHMKSPKGQYLGEISMASVGGIVNTVDSKSDSAMLKRNRLVTVRMSFLLIITVQTNALPEKNKDDTVPLVY